MTAGRHTEEKAMTIGEKIRKRRTELLLTQEAASSGIVTRNMLSLIENGGASPSLETLSKLAKRLELPVEYLISDGDDLFPFLKFKNAERMRYLFRSGRYAECAELISTLGGTDDETEYLLTDCCFRLGKKAVINGSLATAEGYLRTSAEHSNKTAYETERIRTLTSLYLAICKNIQSPLLEFNADEYSADFSEMSEYELTRYISGDTTYDYKNPLFAKHMEAKRFIHANNPTAALSVLRELEEHKSPAEYNALVIFGVYGDIEQCAKKLCDYETAYRYSQKRMTLMNNFRA